MKGEAAANRLAGQLTELTEGARRFFATLKPHPVAPPFFEEAA